MCSISIGNYIYRPSLVDFCSLIAQYNDWRLGERQCSPQLVSDTSTPTRAAHLNEQYLKLKRLKKKLFWASNFTGNKFH